MLSAPTGRYERESGFVTVNGKQYSAFLWNKFLRWTEQNPIDSKDRAKWFDCWIDGYSVCGEYKQ